MQFSKELESERFFLWVVHPYFIDTLDTKGTEGDWIRTVGIDNNRKVFVPSCSTTLIGKIVDVKIALKEGREYHIYRDHVFIELEYLRENAKKNSDFFESSSPPFNKEKAHKIFYDLEEIANAVLDSFLEERNKKIIH